MGAHVGCVGLIGEFGDVIMMMALGLTLGHAFELELLIESSVVHLL